MTVEPRTAATHPVLRAATLNMFCHDLQRDERLRAAAAETRRLGLDVLLLQELWPGAANTFAALSGMTVASSIDLPGSMGNAVFTTLTVEHASTMLFDGVDDGGYQRGAANAHLRGANGRLWHVTSTHLAWGCHSEGRRVIQARALEHAAAEFMATHPTGICVLGGDFNTEADSATVRYLLGADPDWSTMESTLWVDAHRFAGDAETTSNISNPWAAHVARYVGITDPSMLRDRRIDFLLVRGWAYGRPGCPVHTTLGFVDPVDAGDGFAVQVSDHVGIVSNLWDPAP